jgi:aldehyde dehydrogenase (NAD+)
MVEDGLDLNMAAVETLDHLINGVSVAPEAGAYLEEMDPRSGFVTYQIARGTQADIAAAAAAARAALQGWRDRKPVQRSRILTAMAAALRAQAAFYVEIEQRETGKPLALAQVEIEVAAQYFEFYGGTVLAMQAETVDLGPDYHCYTRREPFGVVGCILPWNAPMNQAARSIAPAIAAGNTVVVKPSEFTSVGLLKFIAHATADCGLPAGVVNIVTGTGTEAGAPLVAHPDIAKISFTGSLRAGREIGRVAADRILPVTLELGGKSPDIVFADADFDRAVAGVLRGFTLNAGQACLAGTRCLVERSIHDRFVAALGVAAQALPVGGDDSAGIGPMTTRAQYRKVIDYFALAETEGARVIAGGMVSDRPELAGGWYVMPTIYGDVTNDMRIAREEIFGPVAVVIPFDDEATAIRIANDTEYGLAAGLWTSNLARAHRVAAQLEAGSVYVNEYPAGGVDTPFGGYKKSGIGREKGIEALHHYTQLKSVIMRL